jgi:hypothetical protein
VREPPAARQRRRQPQRGEVTQHAGVARQASDTAIGVVKYDKVKLPATPRNLSGNRTEDAVVGRTFSNRQREHGVPVEARPCSVTPRPVPPVQRPTRNCLRIFATTVNSGSTTFEISYSMPCPMRRLAPRSSKP